MLRLWGMRRTQPCRFWPKALSWRLMMLGFWRPASIVMGWADYRPINPFACRGSRGYWRLQIQMHGNIIWPIQLRATWRIPHWAQDHILRPHDWCVSLIGFTPMM